MPPDPDPAAGPPADAYQVVLRHPGGHERVFTRHGCRVDAGPVPQTLDSPQAAADHLDRYVRAARRQGWTVAALRQGAAVGPPPGAADGPGEDAIDGFEGSFTVRGGAARIIFEAGPDDGVPLAVCRALVERLGRVRARSLHVLCDFAVPGTAWERALAGAGPLPLEDVVVDVPFQTQTRQRDNTLGDLTALLRACPRLRRLFVTGRPTLRAARHAGLRELYLLGDPVPAATLRALGGGHLPRLTRLVLGLASDAGPVDGAGVLDALLRLDAPALTAVHLNGLDDLPGFLAALARRGVPPPWRTLSVASNGEQADDPVALLDVLTAHAGAFARLDALGVPAEEPDGEDLDRPAPARPVGHWSALFRPEAYDGWTS